LVPANQGECLLMVSLLPVSKHQEASLRFPQTPLLTELI